MKYAYPVVGPMQSAINFCQPKSLREETFRSGRLPCSIYFLSRLGLARACTHPRATHTYAHTRAHRRARASPEIH